MYIRWRWRWRYFIIVFHKVLTQKTSIMAAILESFSSNFFYLLSLSHRILRSAPWYHHWDTFHIYLVVMQINNSTSRTIYIYIYIQTYLWICIKTLVCYIYIYIDLLPLPRDSSFVLQRFCFLQNEMEVIKFESRLNYYSCIIRTIGAI